MWSRYNRRAGYIEVEPSDNQPQVLMTNDEPKGGLLMTTDGPDDEIDGAAVAEADAAAAAAAAAISSCWPVVAAPAVPMRAEVVCVIHLGWTLPDGKKKS